MTDRWMASPADEFVSRGGHKLAAALRAFDLSPDGRVCADLGANVGGFTDCLLQLGARRVYAVERGYGVLDARLRGDPRVIVRERTDARKLALPEPIDLVVIDAGWTRQRIILPAARSLLAPGGPIVSLVKPHYEADRGLLRRGVLPDDQVAGVLEIVAADLPRLGLRREAAVESPLRGHAGNVEWFWLLRPAD